jgi:hypothetical protein
VTTNNYVSLTELHCNFSVFTNRCLVVAFRSGRFSSSGSPNCPRPQLLLLVFQNCNSRLIQPFKFKAKFILRPAVNRQSVHNGAENLEVHEEEFFFQLNPCGHSPYVTTSLTRRRVCLLWICLALSSVRNAHIACYWKFFLMHCTVPKLLIRKRYYLLFLIPVFIVQVTKLVQFTLYNTFFKIPPSTSMHFAIRVRAWRVARLYSVLYNEIALSQKPFGIGHMYIYTFCLEWPILWPPRILTLPLWTLCMASITITWLVDKE